MDNSTEAYLDFDVDRLAEAFDGGVDIACETAAQKLIDLAETNYMNLEQGTGTGEMKNDFFNFKSFYHDGGWVAGVFGDKSGPWTESLGGRAHFFEYGRSAPGKGKGNGGPQPIKQRAQPPRPFIRPAANKIKKEFGGITGKEITRVAKLMNKYSELDRKIMSAVNKIA